MSKLKKYLFKFLRRFEVEIHAENVAAAELSAGKIVMQFPPDTVRLLEIREITPTEVVAIEPTGVDKTTERNAGLAKKVKDELS